MKARLSVIILILCAALFLAPMQSFGADGDFWFDHYKFYRVETDMKRFEVKLWGQFEFDMGMEPKRHVVYGPIYFGNPTIKFHNDFFEELRFKFAHYSLYRFMDFNHEEPFRKVAIHNQFGKFTIFTGAPVAMLAPAWKFDFTHEQPTERLWIDHYKLYWIRWFDPEFRETVGLKDQFDKEAVKVELGRPILFGVPVYKFREGVHEEDKLHHPKVHLVFYNFKAMPYEVRRAARDQFGYWKLFFRYANFLAVPTRKVDWAVADSLP